MRNNRRYASMVLVLLLAGSFPALAQEVRPVVRWEVLKDNSSIEWTAIYGGKPLSGSFADFTADIAFDPARLADSKVAVNISTAKIITEDKDAAQALPGAEWFNAETFPHAVFEAKAFTHQGDEQYRAEGTLTIAGKSSPVVLPFSVHFLEDNDARPPVRYAQMSGQTAIKRSDFALGKGDWAKTDMVLDDVKVSISIKAKEISTPKPAVP